MVHGLAHAYLCHALMDATVASFWGSVLRFACNNRNPTSDVSQQNGETSVWPQWKLFIGFGSVAVEMFFFASWQTPLIQWGMFVFSTVGCLTACKCRSHSLLFLPCTRFSGNVPFRNWYQPYRLNGSACHIFRQRQFFFCTAWPCCSAAFSAVSPSYLQLDR